LNASRSLAVTAQINSSGLARVFCYVAVVIAYVPFQASRRVQLSEGTYKFSLAPKEKILFQVAYRPNLSGKHELFLVVR
jgi:hypothetical protein